MITVRAERPDDADAVSRVNDVAFGGTTESQIVESVRRSRYPSISLVAVADDKEVVGHIFFTPVTVDASGPAVVAMGLGPMAVLPAWQRQGIGSMLVLAGIDECRDDGCELVVVVGHPHFYPRFGFRPAHLLGLRSEFVVPDDVFMAIELVDGSLGGRSALVKYLPQFMS